MKVFILIIILLLTTCSGFIVSKKYYDKKVFYQDFFYFNKQFKTEIIYTQKTLKELLSNNLSGKSSFYSALYDYLFNDIIDIRLNFLNSDEYNFFVEYANSIGRGDSKSQIKFLDGITPFIDEHCKNSIIEYKKYKTLYVKLGFLIGAAICVLFL